MTTTTNGARKRQGLFRLYRSKIERRLYASAENPAGIAGMQMRVAFMESDIARLLYRLLAFRMLSLSQRAEMRDLKRTIARAEAREEMMRENLREARALIRKIAGEVKAPDLLECRRCDGKGEHQSFSWEAGGYVLVTCGSCFGAGYFGKPYPNDDTPFCRECK
jgi:hypothetical protein